MRYAEVGSVATAPLCISARPFITAPQMNMPAIAIPSSAQESAARGGTKIFRIQVTENRNLLLLEVFHQKQKNLHNIL